MLDFMDQLPTLTQEALEWPTTVPGLLLSKKPGVGGQGRASHLLTRKDRQPNSGNRYGWGRADQHLNAHSDRGFQMRLLPPGNRAYSSSSGPFGNMSIIIPSRVC